MNFLVISYLYVISDPFFWATMSFTTMTGIFIGAVIYNGDVGQIKKFIASLGCYIILILSVNLSRIISQIEYDQPIVSPQPFASIVTIILVTIFYLLGMAIGVLLVKRAHKGGKLPNDNR
jgi:hypothetical protein